MLVSVSLQACLTPMNVVKLLKGEGSAQWGVLGYHGLVTGSCGLVRCTQVLLATGALGNYVPWRPFIRWHLKPCSCILIKYWFLYKYCYTEKVSELRWNFSKIFKMFYHNNHLHFHVVRKSEFGRQCISKTRSSLKGGDSWTTSHQDFSQNIVTKSGFGKPFL